jgi:hypothetical protein
MCVRLESTPQRRYDTHEFLTFCYSGFFATVDQCLRISTKSSSMQSVPRRC